MVPSLVLMVLLSLTLPSVMGSVIAAPSENPSTMSIDSASGMEGSILGGYVFDRATMSPIPDSRIKVTGANFIGNSTSTDEIGWYSMRLPEGDFVLTVMEASGIEVYRTAMTIGHDTQVRMDLPVDTSMRNNSRVRGNVTDVSTGDPIKGISVRLRAEVGAGGTAVATTGDDGSYDLNISSGAYIIETWANGRIVETGRIEVHWGQTIVRDISIEGAEGEGGPTQWKKIVTSLVDHWYSLLGMILSLAICLILYNLTPMVMRRISKGMRTIYKNQALNVVRYIRVNIITLFIILEVFFLGTFIGIIERNLWNEISQRTFDIFFIIFIIFAIICLRSFLMDLVKYSSGSERTVVDAGGTGLRGGIRRMLSVPTPHLQQAVPILNFVILVIGILIIISTTVSSFGPRRSILASMSDFLSENMNYLYFIVIVVLIAWLLKRMFKIIFENMARNAKETSPDAVRLAGRVVTGFTFFFAGMIILVAILQRHQLRHPIARDRVDRSRHRVGGHGWY
jgi:hypothetical protein